MSSYTFIYNVNDLYNFQKSLSSTFPTLTSVTNESIRNNLTINFSSILTTTDYNNLINFITNYNNTTNTEYLTDLKTIAKSQYYSTSYIRCYTWQYMGLKNRNLAKVVLLARLEPAKASDTLNVAFTYNIRLVNVTSNVVLGTGTFSNSVDNYNTVYISGNANDECTLELQVKKTSATIGLYVEINNITFYTTSI